MTIQPIQPIQPLHPFPARMDPGAGLEGLVASASRDGLVVLDPMMGSGTVPVLAAQRGHQGLGFDVDPLAVTMASALAQPLPRDAFLKAAQTVTDAGEDGPDWEPEWDAETSDFVSYWFDRNSRRELGRMARAIDTADVKLAPALWCAFSRLIITKDAGASRARDVSHSRPHRVRDHASFSPASRFASSASAVLARHDAARVGWIDGGFASVALADARKLPLDDASVDVVATSPPYLHAIDYLRGHRMSLVWMGWQMSELREIRGTAIGTKRGLQESNANADAIASAAAERKLHAAAHAVVRRYVVDLDEAIAELRRVLRPGGGQMRFIVSVATVAGTRVSIAKIIDRVAAAHGFARTERTQRGLRADRRYLPPPSKTTGDLERRMRFEQILTFAAS